MKRRDLLVAALAFAAAASPLVVACSGSSGGTSGPPITTFDAGKCKPATSGVTCSLGAAYSCNGFAAPSGACTEQGPAADGTLTYCCTETPECAADPSGAACGDAGGSSFVCTAYGLVPDGESTNPCTFTGRTADGLEGVCCTDHCSAVADAATCFPQATSAYDCPGSTIPSTDPSVDCVSFGRDDNGITRYCCTAASCIDMGPELYSVPGCEQSGATLYGCKGGADPSQSDPKIWCTAVTTGSLSTTAGMLPEYCCWPSSCQLAFGSFLCDTTQQAVKCQGNATPAQLDPSYSSCTLGQSSDPNTKLYCCNGG